MAREMKDSGLPWVGKIPSDWEIKRLKYAADYFYKGNGITKDEVFEDGDISCIRYGEIYSKYNGAFVNCISKTKLMVQVSPRHIKKGDILFACTGELVEEIGKNIVYMGDNPCLVGGDIIVMRHQQDPIFMNYALNSYAQTQKSEGKAKLKVVHISSKDIQNLMVLLPTLPEQQAIANFLDEKCAEIDGLLADLDAEVKTLAEYKKSIIAETVTRGQNPNAPMKQSGIPWAETIPAHWTTEKGKYLFELRRTKGNPHNQELMSPSQKYGVIPQSQLEGVVLVKEKTDLNTFRTIRPGDFCISLRSFQGGFEYSRYEGVVSPAYQVFYPNKPIIDGFFKYMFKSEGFISYINTFSMSLRDGKNIAFEDFGNSYIPIPPIEEQNAIATYLDKKCSIIDQSIADKQTQIEALKSYKSSLIYEYVTGKKQVI